MDQIKEAFSNEDSPLRLAYVGFILFVALGLVLNMLFNDPKDGNKSAQGKQDNSAFQVAADGGVLKTYPKDEDDNISLKLSKKIKISEDTFIFRFSFDESKTFGLPIGKHVVFSANIKTKAEPNGELVCRKYTPISMVSQKGYIDFLIKVYFANVVPRFPDGGIMSQYVNDMKIGDEMQMLGPNGRLQYNGFGNFIIQKKEILGKKKIGCVAGGTGITPVYQVLQAALKNKDGTQLSLVFGNRTPADILLKDELQAFADNYKDDFKLYFTVDIKPDEKENWKQGVGFITQEMLKEHMPPPASDTLILYCGPPPFEKMMKTHLSSLGYDDTMQFKF